MFPSSGTGKTGSGQPVLFCNGDLCAVLCHYSCTESQNEEIFVSADFCNGEGLTLGWRLQWRWLGLSHGCFLLKKGQGP